MIFLSIKHEDGEREIMLHAKNMKELIDEKLPNWLPSIEDDLPFLKKTKRFKRDQEGEEAKERESGWYYDC